MNEIWNGEISMKIIPHEEQRYSTSGDWWFDGDGILQIRIDDDLKQDTQFRYAIHEMIEAYLCRKRDIKESEVTAFDKKFEEERGKGIHAEGEEPGDHPKACYGKEHAFALVIDSMILQELRK